MHKSKKKIAFAGPWITQKEIDYVVDAVRNGCYETFNKDIVALREEVCRYLGVKHGIPTHCCTLALHLACASLGLKPGDEVICTDFSWVATAYSIVYTRAKPVFVDIEPDTWCISPAAIEAAITPSTKAIMLVHSFGVPADMTAIMDIAHKHDLLVIEDAAPSLGANHKGQKTGTFGNIGCFSFQGAKIAVSGEGGILVTNDEYLYKRALHLSEMGRNDEVTKTRFWSDTVGYQYTIANLTAAMARAQVERIEELVDKKRRIFSWYEERLGHHPRLSFVRERQGDKANYCYPSALIDNITKPERDCLVAKLADLNIHARPAFPRMSTFPTLEARFSNPVAAKVAAQGISLPSAGNLDENDIDFVCEAMRSLL